MLDYDVSEERRKLALLIRERLVHRFFFSSSGLPGDEDGLFTNQFDENANAHLGVIYRSGSFGLLSFSLLSLSKALRNNNKFSEFIGTVAEYVSELLCRAIPRIYVYGGTIRDVLYSLVDFYRKPYNELVNPRAVEPTIWSKWSGKDINLWHAPPGSCFKNIDLSNWGVTVQKLEFAFGDASVVLPGGIRPGNALWPKHWPIWDMEYRYEDWCGSDGRLHLAPPGFNAEWRKWQSNPRSYVPPLPLLV